MPGYYPKLTQSYIIHGVHAVACRRYRPPLLWAVGGESKLLAMSLRSEINNKLCVCGPQEAFEDLHRSRLPFGRGISTISQVPRPVSRGEPNQPTSVPVRTGTYRVSYQTSVAAYYYTLPTGHTALQVQRDGGSRASA